MAIATLLDRLWWTALLDQAFRTPLHQHPCRSPKFKVGDAFVCSSLELRLIINVIFAPILAMAYLVTGLTGYKIVLASLDLGLALTHQ
jgi:hypothetical protein